MKVAAIIQARMGSSRLPGKVLKLIDDKTVLKHIVERINQADEIDSIIIATTKEKNDEIIEVESNKMGVQVFRGSENDVLSRYYFSAKENKVDIVIRITSDCPLIDPHIIDNMVREFKKNKYSLITNVGLRKEERTFPRGLDTEVFDFTTLENAYLSAYEDYHREHVTPYIYEKSDNIKIYKNKLDYSNHRWTLDTAEDFILIKSIYSELYNGNHNFYLDEIIELFKKNPELFAINNHIEQKNFKSSK